MNSGSAGDDVAAWLANSRSEAWRAERAVPVALQADLGEETRHEDALLEPADARFGALPTRERVASSGSGSPPTRAARKAAPEPRVDVGDRRSAQLAEALHVGRALDPDRFGDSGPVRDQLLVLDRGALDRLSALGEEHRPRDRVEATPVHVTEYVDRELLAAAHLLDEGATVV